MEPWACIWHGSQNPLILSFLRKEGDPGPHQCRLCQTVAPLADPPELLIDVLVALFPVPPPFLHTPSVASKVMRHPCQPSPDAGPNGHPSYQEEEYVGRMLCASGTYFQSLLCSCLQAELLRLVSTDS